QRGRDFAVMLSAFNNLGYSVEWRVINAADYGRAQRRRRVFFFVFRNDTPYAKNLDEIYEPEHLEFFHDENMYDNYIFNDGLFAKQFPVEQTPIKNRYASYTLPADIVNVSDNFSGKVWNTGIMRHNRYFTIDTAPIGNEKPIKLGENIQCEKEVSEQFYVTNKEKLEKFHYLRRPKRIERTSTNGHTYTFSEGGMSPYDELNKPSRTMLTSDGSVNRS